MNRMHILTLLTIVLAATLLPGCLGYSGESLYRSGIKTIAVPNWKRGERVFRRNHEITLTEALDKRILLTPYAKTSRNRADTVIEGTLDRISQSYMGMNPDTGVPRERQLTIWLTFTWKDLRTGKELLRKENFPVTVTYRPTQAVMHGSPEISPSTLGQSTELSQDFTQAMQRLCDKAAMRIVELMERDWNGQ
ncbi:MAG: hypothetical protein HN909_00125 [Phycisphaerales bacterium]|jgi:hypothetical protein|nr:hypothetical protein [Phycisphaerales bacterium]MBT7170157.1 hypothetical protein [Phycisphaerales bacterium]